MKLELKHLAGYLPYGLEVAIMGELKEPDSHEPIIFELVGLDTNYVEYHEIGRSVTEQAVFSDCFPILRPLSDLTKEIEVNGEKFVPIVELAFTSNLSMYQFIDGLFYSNNYGKYLKIKEMPYVVIEKLYEWHFDIHGLIEKSLAIDKKTLL